MKFHKRSLKRQCGRPKHVETILPKRKKTVPRSKGRSATPKYRRNENNLAMFTNSLNYIFPLDAHFNASEW